MQTTKDKAMRKEMVFVNEKLPLIRKYISDNSGCSPEIWEHEAGVAYKEAMNKIREFDGQKVQLSFNSENDCVKITEGSKIGKIKIDDEGRIRFFEGKKTTRFYYLDAGIFLGWFATLIPTKIKTI